MLPIVFTDIDPVPVVPDKPVEGPVEGFVDAPVEEPVEEPVDELVNGPVDGLVDGPVGIPGDGGSPNTPSCIQSVSSNKSIQFYLKR